MPGYLDKAFIRFKHEKPIKIQNSPHPHVIPQYGVKTQYAAEEIDSPPLSKEETTYVQAVAGTLLYHARAVDRTILTALSAIATEQAKPTQETMKRAKQLLDYCATQEDAMITYNASKMILAVHSDAGYANEKKSQSQAGGHFFLDTTFHTRHIGIQNYACVYTRFFPLCIRHLIQFPYLCTFLCSF